MKRANRASAYSAVARPGSHSHRTTNLAVLPLRLQRIRVEVPNLDVAKAREKTCLSQDRFAGAFAINPSTLRNWEQGAKRVRSAASG